MKRLLWGAVFTLIAVSIFASVGCSSFSKENAPVVFTNESRNNVALSINGAVVHEARGLESARFVVEVDVARARYDGYSTGPSQLDRITQITVSVLNRDLNERSNTQTCYAGAKITTSITYQNFPYDRAGRVDCHTLDAHGREIPGNDLARMAGFEGKGGSY